MSMFKAYFQVYCLYFKPLKLKAPETLLAFEHGCVREVSSVPTWHWFAVRGGQQREHPAQPALSSAPSSLLFRGGAREVLKRELMEPQCILWVQQARSGLLFDISLSSPQKVSTLRSCDKPERSWCPCRTGCCWWAHHRNTSCPASSSRVAKCARKGDVLGEHRKFSTTTAQFHAWEGKHSSLRV